MNIKIALEFFTILMSFTGLIVGLIGSLQDKPAMYGAGVSLFCAGVLTAKYFTRDFDRKWLIAAFIFLSIVISKVFNGAIDGAYLLLFIPAIATSIYVSKLSGVKYDRASQDV